MKRVVLIALLTLTLPMAAWATSIDFSNVGGTVSGSASAGLTLSSELVAVTGLSGGPFNGPDLGDVVLKTGAFSPATSGGTIAGNGTFGAGSITITGNGSNGIPTGVLFTGTFTTATWTSLGTQTDGTHVFMLTAIFDNVPGHTFQGIVDMGNGFTGTGIVTSGNTYVVIPEPGTLGLLGTGLLGVAGLVRRKLTS
jgi:hypothetical protein